MKQPRCALVKAVEAYMKKLCELKLDTAVIPKEIGECSILHTMTPTQRKVTCVSIMKRVADHGINTGRLGADTKDASVFFLSHSSGWEFPSRVSSPFSGTPENRARCTNPDFGPTNTP